MSIADLNFKLLQLNQSFFEQKGSHSTLCEPHKLAREVEKIGAAFAFGAQDMAGLPAERIRDAVVRLCDQGVETLNYNELKYVAWGMNKQFDFMPQSVLATASLGGAYLSLIEQEYVTNISKSLWRGLAFGFFQPLADDVIVQHENWRRLGHIVGQGFMDMAQKALKKPLVWQLIEQHQNDIFITQNLKALGQVCIEDQTLLPLLGNGIGIAEESWFYHQVFKEGIRYLCDLVDSDFKASIQELLALAEAKPLFVDFVLTTVLTRYYASRYRHEIDDGLKRMVMKHWGNPNFSQSGAWHLVELPVKKMVAAWIIKEELEAFFSILQSSYEVDHRRLEYWLRFLPRIEYSEMVLGPEAIHSQVTRFKEFKIKFQGRYKRLESSTDKRNNAFIFKIDRYVIVEYALTGNATYIYHVADFEYRRPYYEHDVMRQTQYVERLSHRGDWEQRFDQALQRLGIFPER